ncbi:MAG TPA: type II secretion system F family protein [Micromonosporaceae bacterium]|nr:type II secretion system F family protein [Micromonosporaceae bacterium]
MTSWQLPVAVVGGAAAGAGVFLIVRELLPAVPSLGPTLARLRPRLDVPGAPGTATGLGRWGFLTRWLTVPAKDLAILGRGVDAYLASVVTSALIGLFLPAVLVALLFLAGVRLPVALPAGSGIVVAVLFGAIAHRDVSRRAAAARREFSRAFCTYLDLVVLELTAAGPVQAMERAARVCHGWVFDRVDDALTRAQLQMVFPWDQLRALGDEIGVVELRDFAAIMQSAGDAGAQVQTTLREQSDSLRDRLRTDALGRAEAVSAKLEMPAALLVIVLAIFMIYPLIARLG